MQPPPTVCRSSPALTTQENQKRSSSFFDYLIYHSPFQAGDELTIYTDSQYALSLLLGSSIPTTHHQAQQYYTALRCCYRNRILNVPSHEGIPGNELADSLAKRGVTSFGTLVAFTHLPLPPSGLQTEVLINSMGCLSPPPSRMKFLLSKIKETTPLIPILPSAKKPWISFRIPKYHLYRYSRAQGVS